MCNDRESLRNYYYNAYIMAIKYLLNYPLTDDKDEYYL